MEYDEEIFKPATDCAVCLQKYNHPTQLPCGHIFCFLCVKGIAFQSKKCAMCRAVIPANYLDNPKLLESLSNEEVDTSNIQDDAHQWFYEGRNGWWKYDEQSNIELETAFNSGATACTLLLAGTLYNIDFESMTQVKRSDQTRCRPVRRDSPMFPSKGIAGITTDNTNTRQTKNEEEADMVEIIEVVDEVIEISDSDDNEVIEISDSEDNEVIEISDSEDNEVSNPGTVQNDDISHICDRFSALNLEEANHSEDHEDTWRLI